MRGKSAIDVAKLPKLLDLHYYLLGFTLIYWARNRSAGAAAGCINHLESHDT